MEHLRNPSDLFGMSWRIEPKNKHLELSYMTKRVSFKKWTNQISFWPVKSRQGEPQRLKCNTLLGNVNSLSLLSFYVKIWLWLWLKLCPFLLEECWWGLRSLAHSKTIESEDFQGCSARIQTWKAWKRRMTFHKPQPAIPLGLLKLREQNKTLSSTRAT